MPKEQRFAVFWMLFRIISIFFMGILTNQFCYVLCLPLTFCSRVCLVAVSAVSSDYAARLHHLLSSMFINITYPSC